MVYQKSAIKVLLGPEKFQNAFESAHELQDYDTEHFPVQFLSPRRQGSQVFEKIGETNVYKRTRPFYPVHARPRLERFPSGLELSGQKVETDGSISKAQSAVIRDSEDGSKNEGSGKLEDMPLQTPNGRQSTAQVERDLQSADSRQTPALSRSRRERTQYSDHQMSKNLLTEFGLRSQRTDTFSGHRRRRGTSAAAEMERQLEMSAERHIRTCQVAGNLKRSSLAQQNIIGLKNTVSPLHSPLSLASMDRTRRPQSLGIARDKHFHRSNQHIDSNDHMVPYMIQLRKTIGSVPKLKTLNSSPRHDGLQGISSRTMIVGSGIDIS